MALTENAEAGRDAFRRQAFPYLNLPFYRKEIEQVLEHCQFYHFLIVELAIDFKAMTGVNTNFIRNHAVFGKSRSRANNKDK